MVPLTCTLPPILLFALFTFLSSFWDNVGGETFDHALANSALHARFLECGMITLHNDHGDVRFKPEVRVPYSLRLDPQLPP